MTDKGLSFLVTSQWQCLPHATAVARGEQPPFLVGKWVGSGRSEASRVPYVGSCPALKSLKWAGPWMVEGPEDHPDPMTSQSNITISSLKQKIEKKMKRLF